MRKAALTLASLGPLVLLLGEAPAAGQGASAPATPPSNAAPASPGPKSEPPKPAETAPAPTAESPASQPESDGKPVTLAEMTREGFEIRATTFVPAEAVTRQSGKVASDAVIMTLQKAEATAVCFYTLKAYVGKTLDTIPACTIHR
jgi:hypothetical protein